MSAGPKFIVSHTTGIDQRDYLEGVSALRQHLVRYGVDEADFLAARYELLLVQIRQSSEGAIFRWKIVPLGGVVEYSEWGEEKAKTYKRPKSACSSNINDPRYVYRGMAWEEWQAIQKRGYIESNGSHNLDQKGLTFFGNAPTAEYYATNFAPFAYKPSLYRPGVVLAIPRELAMDHTDLPKKIPPDEYAVEGKIPFDYITGIWFITPTRISYGYVEIIRKRDRVIDGSRSSPSVLDYAILCMK